MQSYDYDLFVIGGGSGGVRAARLAASLGHRVAIAEEHRFGGTCVIRGCVPKKLFVYAAEFSEHFEDAVGYGWRADATRFDWNALRAAKDGEVARLEALYRQGLSNSGAELISSRAELVDANTLRLIATGRTVTAKTILIATGSRPNPHEELPGHALSISSNEAFDLPELPRSILIAGGGYIAVEFANIFHGMGVSVSLVLRGQQVLSRFDQDLRQGLHQAMADKGIRLLTGDGIESIASRNGGGLQARLSGGRSMDVDQVMLALGRLPNTRNLGLEAAGVATDPRGAIKVDAWSRTSAANIYAVGDVTHRMQLTPVAIHEAMCFVETVFKNNPTTPDYDRVATAVFSLPEVGTVGLSEQEASERYADVDIYRAHFRPMKATLSGRKGPSMMKLVVEAESRRVVGAHVMGPHASEMAQLLAVALKAGATKDDFDRTMAVHPTAAEEFVTLYAPSYRVTNPKVRTFCDGTVVPGL